MKRLDISELIFKIVAYTLVTVFALACVFPFVYTLSIAISGRNAVEAGEVTFFPIDIQFAALNYIINRSAFWIAYSNTIFLTLYGTIFSMFVSITGAYVLSKDKLLWKRQWNFLLVFTMWFTAGLIPSYLNYRSLGIDDRWGIIFGLGMNAFNIILLRNYFNGIPKEIEEAAIVDGANEFQVLLKIYIPMSTASIATVTLFYALSRWNGYFWANQLLEENADRDRPLQVYLRNITQNANQSDNVSTADYASDSLVYAMVVFSIIPIIVIYPYIQKFFAKGVNVGGVKE